MGRGSPAEVAIRVEPGRAAARSSGPGSGRTGGKDDIFRPFRPWTPWLVPSFVAVNVALFVATMYVNDCPERSGSSCVGRGVLGRFSFQPFKENPLLGPSADALEKMGALEVEKVVHEHQGWRLVTCIWLHAGVFHILANMLSLLFIGIKLEQEFGFVRIGALYVLSGFGGSLLSALFIQSKISVGASGALFGLLGGMLSELITNWTIYANKLAALLTLILIIALNLGVGLLPHVDNFAHIGGFLSGFLLGFIFLIRPHFGYVSQKNAPPAYRADVAPKKHKTYQYVLCVAAAIFLTASFAFGIVLLFRGYNANDHCPWCHYLTCVPTSKWNCNQNTQTCQATSDEFQLMLTCEPSGKSRTYSTPNATDELISSLCTELCS